MARGGSVLGIAAVLQGAWFAREACLRADGKEWSPGSDGRGSTGPFASAGGMARFDTLRLIWTRGSDRYQCIIHFLISRFAGKHLG